MKNKKVKMFGKMMKQVSDLVEEDLKLKGMYYERDGTIFNVKDEDIPELLKSQYKANIVLFQSGELSKDIVMEMFTIK